MNLNYQGSRYVFFSIFSLFHLTNFSITEKLFLTYGSESWAQQERHKDNKICRDGELWNGLNSTLDKTILRMEMLGKD